MTRWQPQQDRLEILRERLESGIGLERPPSTEKLILEELRAIRKLLEEKLSA